MRVSEALQKLQLPQPMPQPTATGGTIEPQCGICGDLGWVRRDVPPEDPAFGRAIECRCGIVARRRLARLDETFGFTVALQRRRWDDLRPIAAQRAALTALCEFICNPRGWVYLHGPFGDGKTTLLAMAINELRSAGQEAVFCVVPELFTYLRGTFRQDSPVSFDETWEYIKAVPILGLDDLGAESGTPWVDEKLYELMGWRYRAELPTIVTSNLAPDALRDPRLASRFGDVALCRVAFCGKHDVRRLRR